jgi:uncharacterized protein
MVVGTLELHLRIESSYSLKDKRRVLRSLVDRVRRDFQVAIAEVGDQDLWNVAVLGAAYVSDDPHHIESVLQKVVDAFERSAEVEVEAAVREIERK